MRQSENAPHQQRRDSPGIPQQHTQAAEHMLGKSSRVQARADPGMPQALSMQRTPPRRRPVRSRKLEPEAMDPEDAAFHTLHWAEDEWLGTSNPGKPALPLAYQPVDAADQEQDAGIGQQGGSQLHAQAGYVVQPHAAQQQLQASGSLPGLGTLHGPSYRYAVDEEGEIVDMVRISFYPLLDKE